MPKDDPAIQRALKFVSRCQNLPGEIQDQPFAAKATADDKGGFVYKPDPDDKEHQTAAGGLRSLGAMTYGGLKSFLYAGVKKDDPRVQGAIQWIRAHYTLDENPGLKQAGLFYYFHTFGKAMAALGDDTFEDAQGKKHDWRQELFDALKSRQQDNGSWINKGDRAFGEADDNLATGFRAAGAELHEKVGTTAGRRTTKSHTGERGRREPRASEDRVLSATPLAGRCPHPIRRPRMTLLRHPSAIPLGRHCLSGPGRLRRADAFDDYTNPLLIKAAASDAAKEMKQITSDDLLNNDRTLKGVDGTLLIVKTNDGRNAKLLVHAAGQKTDAEHTVPTLYIDRFVTYKEGEERTVRGSGQNLALFPGFRFSLDMGQVVPEALGGDLRFVQNGDKTWVEPVGKAKLYMLVKPLPEAAPAKPDKVVIGEKFDPEIFQRQVQALRRRPPLRRAGPQGGRRRLRHRRLLFRQGRGEIRRPRQGRNAGLRHPFHRAVPAGRADLPGLPFQRRRQTHGRHLRHERARGGVLRHAGGVARSAKQGPRTMQVFITGGTGQIGSRLVPRLRARGDQPVVLTRRPAAAEKQFGTDARIVEGDPMRPGPWQDAAADCDAVVNLAGENQFSRRWNAAFKTLLVDSRIEATRNVVAALTRKSQAATTVGRKRSSADRPSAITGRTATRS